MPLLVASANVCTLLDKSYATIGVADYILLGRAQILERSFHAAGILIAGIQESRIQEFQAILGLQNTMYASGVSTN